MSHAKENEAYGASPEDVETKVSKKEEKKADEDYEGGRGETGAYEGDENQERGNWSNPMEFILSCVGYAVGLGNVWRFPIHCYEWGGGNFLILYWCLALFLGFPIILMEQSLGQFTSQGPTHAWRFARAYKGIGVAMCIVSLMVGVYYNMIIGWGFYYMFSAFTSVVPWQQCQMENSEISWTDWACRSKDYDPSAVCCSGLDFTLGTDGLCYNSSVIQSNQFANEGQATTVAASYFSLLAGNVTFEQRNMKGAEMYNDKFNAFMKRWNLQCNSSLTADQFAEIAVFNTTTWKKDLDGDQVALADIAKSELSTTTVLGIWNNDVLKNAGYRMKLSSEYFYDRMLGKDDPLKGYGLANMGSPQWQNILCLLLAWAIVYVCLINGIKSAGKVVWFTALAPYVILLILLIRAALLDGAGDGVSYYLTPKWEKFGKFGMWFAASTQLFFSLSACWGGMIALSSYNKFHNNVFRDTIITIIVDSATSFFAGFVIFSMIGHFAHMTQSPIEDVVVGGTGLAFKVYPMALTYLPGTPFWAVMFAALLVLLGLDSEFNLMETVFTVLLDAFPIFRKRFLYKSLFFLGMCTVGFLIGIPFTCPGGGDLMDLVDLYAAGWTVLFIGIFETTSIGWVYGYERWCKHINFMTGGYFPMALKWPLGFWWCIFDPIFIIIIMVGTWVEFKPSDVAWANALGWIMTIFVMGWVPGYIIWNVFFAPESKEHDSLPAKIKSAFSPAKDWGPYLKKYRAEVAEYDNQIIVDGNTRM